MLVIYFLLRDDFESLKCCLDPWLCGMFDCIHVCVFVFLINFGVFQNYGVFVQFLGRVFV